tara:strand:+ start:2360 stop:2716 length:357 start_codon:yes stop_codon:yes gene_type:complete
MTSTRISNRSIEYSLEKEKNKKHMEYLLNVTAQENLGQAKMFDFGGGVPKLPSSKLSHNNIDIESKLRGIKSTNLEGNNFNPDLQQKTIGTAVLFERQGIQLPPSILHHSQKSGFHNI